MLRSFRAIQNHMDGDEPTGSVTTRPLRRILFGGSGLRAGWRLLAFLAILMLLMGVRDVAIRRVGNLDGTTVYVFNQATRFLFCLLASGLMAKFEGRSIGEYGLPWRQTLRLHFWQGMLMGFAAMTALLGIMGMAGVFQLGSIDLSHAGLWTYAVAYGLICLVIGLSEEFFFRGYVQFTAATGIGFWPAAILLSSYFGFSHLDRATETWVGALNAGLGGLLLCLFLKRTDNLWLSIGFHTSFNWAQIYFYGVPVSGVTMPGHLFNSTLSGPAHLTGGTVGPEGSWLCTLTLAGVALAFAAIFRAPERTLRAAGE